MKKSQTFEPIDHINFDQNIQIFMNNNKCNHFITYNNNVCDYVCAHIITYHEKEKYILTETFDEFMSFINKGSINCLHYNYKTFIPIFNILFKYNILVSCNS